MLEHGQTVANFQQAARLFRARHEYNFGFGVIQDVGHAIGRFVEINRHVHGAQSENREIGHVPFRAIGRKHADAIARSYT